MKDLLCLKSMRTHCLGFASLLSCNQAYLVKSNSCNGQKRKTSERRHDVDPNSRLSFRGGRGCGIGYQRDLFKKGNTNCGQNLQSTITDVFFYSYQILSSLSIFQGAAVLLDKFLSNAKKQWKRQSVNFEGDRFSLVRHRSQVSLGNHGAKKVGNIFLSS